MPRLALTLLLLGLLAVPLNAQEKEKEDAPAKNLSPAEKVQANPDDFAGMMSYLNAEFRKVAVNVSTDPDQAEKTLDAVAKTLADLKPTKDETKELVQKANRAVEQFREQVALGRVKIEDLQKQLVEKADSKVFTKYVGKVSAQVAALSRTEPEKAETMLKDARAFVAKVQKSADDETLDRLAENAERTFAGLERRLESALKLTKLVGKEAAPLKVSAWVNGKPLTDDDLKGKVVLLDFWAVWCGPCVATFPHLREWQEKYADQGLVMVGLTSYYQYEWDEDAERASRGKDVSEEQEQAMLEQFAEHHKLEHRFAIQDGRDLAEYYGVGGIPHVVVIDRQGKVALIRVGSGEQNAKDIEATIKKLIGAES